MKLVREPEHVPRGDPCKVGWCGLPASRHRVKRKRGEKGRARRKSRDTQRRDDMRAAFLAEPIVAIDGEGQDDPCSHCGEPKKHGEDRDRGCPARDGELCSFPHVYTYLSAVNEDGVKLGSVASAQGLTTAQCLDFILGLGVRRVFGFSLGYDHAMWLRDMPDRKLYDLVRPERREKRLTMQNGDTRIVHRSVYWLGFKLGYLQRKLTVQAVKFMGEEKKSLPLTDTITVWDVFAFYQGSFAKALGDWKTSSAQEVIDRITLMKSQRDRFAELSFIEIQRYCDDECHLLAKLVRQLIEAHERADLPLKNFYGAGSTGSALLTRLGVKEYRAEPPPEMIHDVACGFVGGRFELSRVGPVRVRCWGHDISSAYPYQMARLPCLNHGRWQRVRGGKDLERRIREAQLALVHCEVKQSGPRSWGPLPWRTPKRIDKIAGGSILFPLRCDGTWVWKDEYLAASETLWPGVRARDAWTYETDCDCKPFWGVTDAYVERCKLGKDGPGIVLKLGINSGYGKCAQSRGSAPFRSWVWAGNITSGTRGQLLRAIATAEDPDNVLMVATDGILATEKLKLPPPVETGTGETGKPLGGWEIKEAKGGVFLCRPGIYFPLGADADELKEVRSRGISRTALLKHSGAIQKHFAEHGASVPYVVRGTIRFVGLKQGITSHDRGRTIARGEAFSRWIPYPIQVSFAPGPKRAEVTKDLRLTTWERMPGETAPYDGATGGLEAEALRQLTEIMSEQPNGDVCFEG